VHAVDLLESLDVATCHFGRCLAAVSTDQWSWPTPCDEWDVQYLVAHVIGGNRFTCAVLAGRSADDAIAEVMSSSQLGDDPTSSWFTTVERQAAAFRRPDMLETPIDHPVGPITGGDLLGFRVFDITVHAWDLARAVGVDDTLPADLVDDVIAVIESGPPGMGFGIRHSESTMHASRQDLLLAMTGRSGNRTPVVTDGG
jgi:uncharacterized protein (TIGR03086 family)